MTKNPLKEEQSHLYLDLLQNQTIFGLWFQVNPSKILSKILPILVVPETETSRRKKLKDRNLMSKENINGLNLKCDEKWKKTKPIEKNILVKKIRINFSTKS